MVEDLAQEKLGSFVLGVFEKFTRWLFFDDLATVHENDTVRNRRGEAHFVGNYQHGHAAFSELDHDIEHLLDHFRVEGGGGLVKQHDPWVHAK